MIPTALHRTLALAPALALFAGLPLAVQDDPKGSAEVETRGDEAAALDASEGPGEPMVFELGEHAPDLLIPRGERLKFGVDVAVGPVGATVGKVHIDSGVDPYVESMLMMTRPEGEEEREVGWLRAKAEGGYLFYDMTTVLDSRYLPKEWPRVSHFYRQSGSENRRRESTIGTFDGRHQLAFRGDTRHGAPSGQRIWQDLQYRDVPEGAVDMLGAVFLARTLLAGEEEELTFPLLDKTRLWKMTLTRGAEKVVEVPLGRFDAVEIKLIPSAWPGEPEHDPKKFKGLFGIKGSIHLWVEKQTGVPLRIEGTMPAGPIEIDCDIYLEEATGLPEAFVDLATREAEARAAAEAAKAARDEARSGT